MRSLVIFTFLAAGASGFADDADNWTQFRGPHTDGVVRGKPLPVEWSEQKNILWKVRVPGFAWSQPIIHGEKLFVTTAVAENEPSKRKLDWSPGVSGFSLLLAGAGKNPDLPPPDVEYQWKLVCLDASTGKPLWEQTAKQAKPTFHIHPSNSYASETPATDGERVIASFGMAGLFCYDFDGNQLWTKEFGVYPTQMGWGTGSSPVVHDGRVFVQYDNDAESFLIALDAKTGDEIWRVPRDERSNWATPFVWKNRQRTELIVAGGSKMRSYDPATGAELWTMSASGRTASTPIGDEDLLYIDSYERMTGRMGILAAIKPGASGDISLKGKETTNDSVAWSTKLSGYRVASPALCGGCLYAFEQNGGIMHCFDAKTGARHYRQRLPEAAGVMSSPLASGENVYVLDHEGRTVILAAGPEMKVVATNPLDDLFWSSPAAANGRLFLRGATSLYCVKE
jgi:outer membrane protein assembly factor BamB